MHSDNGALANSFPLARRRGEEKQEEEVDFLEDKGSVDLQAEQRPLPEESSPSSSFSSSSDRRAAAELLKSCGVNFYGPLSKKYSPAFIRAKVEEWRQDPSLGPGMLVRLIQGGGFVVGSVRPIERRSDDSDWRRDRYERGRRVTDEENEVELWGSDD